MIKEKRLSLAFPFIFSRFSFIPRTNQGTWNNCTSLTLVEKDFYILHSFILSVSLDQLDSCVLSILILFWFVVDLVFKCNLNRVHVFGCYWYN